MRTTPCRGLYPTPPRADKGTDRWTGVRARTSPRPAPAAGIPSDGALRRLLIGGVSCLAAAGVALLLAVNGALRFAFPGWGRLLWLGLLPGTLLAGALGVATRGTPDGRRACLCALAALLVLLAVVAVMAA